MNHEDYFEQRRQKILPQLKAFEFAKIFDKKIGYITYKSQEELSGHLLKLPTGKPTLYKQTIQEIISIYQDNTQVLFKIHRLHLIISARFEAVEFCETRDLDRIKEGIEGIKSNIKSAELTSTPRIMAEARLIEYEAYLNYIEGKQK